MRSVDKVAGSPGVGALRSANLAAKFGLELCSLAALGYWGASTGTGATSVALAVAAPSAAAAVWAAFAAPRARLAVTTMDGHALPESRDFLGKFLARLLAQLPNPALQCFARRAEEPLPLLRRQLLRERNWRELCGMQNFI